jgi:D-glycero-D-manno-heptose 1,7-bisphosphate phosphatase
VKPFLFLDRDGTLIRDTVYPRDPGLVELLPGAAEAVREFAPHFHVAVVSNQSGVARGLITPAEAKAVAARFVELLAAASGVTAPSFYCFHGPADGCDCRKPRPGLLRQAAAHYDDPIDAGSVIVGDNPTDLEAGRAAGCGLAVSFAGDWAAASAAIRRHRQ